MLSLNEKVVIVTGAGSIGPGWGNGKAIATLFARQGAIIVAADINPIALEETKGLISNEGATCVTVCCDVTKSKGAKELVARCMSEFGRLDILVNNVGRSEPGGPVELEEAVWDDQMAVNLKSVFLMCKSALPEMERAGAGSVINIASIAGLRYVGKDQVAYAAAKSAVIQFTKTTAVIYARKGIRLNTVVPGLMFTPLVASLANKYAGGDFEGFVARRHAQVPIGRMGDAWDVANAALFLASDEARYITATEIVVDGGITAVTP